MRIFSGRSTSDLIGIGSSLLCIVHCLLLPGIIFVGSLSDDAHRWESLDYAFILLSGVAVFLSTRGLPTRGTPTRGTSTKGASQRALVVGIWLSWVGFSTSILLHEVYALALYSSLLFSCLLVILHLISYRIKHARTHQT